MGLIPLPDPAAPPKKPPRPGAPGHLGSLASLGSPGDSYNEGVKVSSFHPRCRPCSDVRWGGGLLHQLQTPLGVRTSLTGNSFSVFSHVIVQGLSQTLSQECFLIRQDVSLR